jgi:hypothetical protein
MPTQHGLHHFWSPWISLYFPDITQMEMLVSHTLIGIPKFILTTPDFQRTLATNFDPNRDHTKLARQQTRDIKEWLSSFSPHIAIDMHEYGAASRYSGNYSNAADGMYSAAKVQLSLPYFHVDISNHDCRTSTSTPRSVAYPKKSLPLQSTPPCYPNPSVANNT